MKKLLLIFFLKSIILSLINVKFNKKYKLFIKICYLSIKFIFIVSKIIFNLVVYFISVNKYSYDAKYLLLNNIN